MVAVRTLTAIDNPQILTINASSMPGVAALSDAKLRRLEALGARHVVADDADRVLGYSLAFHKFDAYDGEEFLVFRNTMSETFVYIDQIAVLPAMRRAGVARSLYAEIERQARCDRAMFLCCEVNTRPANVESSRFHKHLGFKLKEQLYCCDGRKVDLLIKRLS